MAAALSTPVGIQGVSGLGTVATAPGVITVKTEPLNLMALAQQLRENPEGLDMIRTLFAQGGGPRGPALPPRGRYPSPNYGGGMVRRIECTFCGGEHFIRECAKVEDYIQAGKCRRNFKNRVVLPNGAPVFREGAGRTLMEGVDAWHRRNPNQKVRADMNG